MDTKEKFRRLMAVLDDINDDIEARLDMTTWGWLNHRLGYEHNYIGHGRISDADAEKHWEKPQCKTVACFAGWAFLAPYIRPDFSHYCATEGCEFKPARLAVWLAAGTPLDPEKIEERIFGGDLNIFHPDGRVDKKATVSKLKRSLTEIYEELGLGKRILAWQG